MKLTLEITFLITAITLSFHPLEAQQNNRINTKVEVQRDYEIRIMEITKPKLSPAIPDSLSRFNIIVDYTIFDKPYHDLYSFTPLPPVRLFSSQTEQIPWAHIRLGLTWPITPEVDVSIQAPLTGMSALLLTARHRSFRGELPIYKHVTETIADQMTNKADARYALNWDKGRFEIGGGYDYNYHTYYGIAPFFSESLQPASLKSRPFMRDSMSHTWNIYRADLSLASLKTVQSGTEWSIAVGWSLLEDHARLLHVTPAPTLSENLIRFRGEVGIRLQPEQMYGLAIYGSFSNHPFSSVLDRGIIAINPYYQFHKNRFTFTAGLLISGAHHYDKETEKTNRFFFYPKLEASYQLIPDNLLIYTDIRGENRHNNYQTLLTENPWLSQNIELRTSDQPWNIRAGLKGKMANHFGYNLYGQYVKTNNQYYFKNSSDLYNVFALQYATEQRLSAIAELSWNTKPLTLHLTGKYHSYTLCSGDPAWFKPNIEALFTARYQWRERIVASAVIEYRGEVRAGVPPLQQVPVDEKIKGFTDIGLTLEYRFASWFGLYAEAKNVLNIEKQYYLFYNEPGMRIGGGMTFRF